MRRAGGQLIEHCFWRCTSSWALVIVALMVVVVEQIGIRWGIWLLYRGLFSWGTEPAPLPGVPEGEGGGSSVRWRVVGGEVRFWTIGLELPPGLHGSLWLVRTAGGVRLLPMWTLGFSPLLAAASVGIWPGLRIHPAVGVVTGAAAMTAVIALYASAIPRLLRELRWSLAQSLDD